MKRPVLGLNMDVHTEADDALEWCRIRFEYARAIVEAGGLPLPIPAVADEALLRQYLSLLDGVVLSGGADYPPAMYGAESHPKTRPCAETRAQADFLLARLLFSESDLPVLGICLGHQLIGVAHGGGLIQHLPRAEQHISVRPGLDREHRVRLAPGCFLHGLFNAESIRVNSAHHQGLDPESVPDDLEAVAWDEDGMIEAVQGRNRERFVLGVQWHPERIRDIEHRRRLFSAFMDVCRCR